MEWYQVDGQAYQARQARVVPDLDPASTRVPVREEEEGGGISRQSGTQDGGQNFSSMVGVGNVRIIMM